MTRSNVPLASLTYTVAMTHADAIEIQALKADSFGRIALMRGADGAVRASRPAPRAGVAAPAGVVAGATRGAARCAASPACPRRRNCCAGTAACSIAATWTARRCTSVRRAATSRISARARRLLQHLHRRGVAHNDLAKEANWLVLTDGTPALIDFQLAMRGHPRSRWMRLLAREDLRHLLKHKRMYCPQALTPVERRLLQRRSWLRDAWFATGKPVYRFVTRRLLQWEDNEGQGPKP